MKYLICFYFFLVSCHYNKAIVEDGEFKTVTKKYSSMLNGKQRIIIKKYKNDILFEKEISLLNTRSVFLIELKHKRIQYFD